MKVFNYKNIVPGQIKGILKRPASNFDSIEKIVKPILNDIKKHGDATVLKYAKKYDDLNNRTLKISTSELTKAAKRIPTETKKAIDIASINIEKFHLLERPRNFVIETMPGVKCSRKFLPIENVGLYIPGGSAVLISTMLMLGIPANLAGCKRIVVCSPLNGNQINPALAYAILKCNIKEVYAIGGAQAIGMMAYGTKSILKVDKIFGPGNQFVTMSKTLVSIDSEGCAIDMPAGPSEVLVLADEKANPAFVASDLLSQAEHGIDSQVILLTKSDKLIVEVLKEIRSQLKLLPRKEIALKCLNKSVIIKIPNYEKAVNIINEYAPEHLIINLKKPDNIIKKITNAGSVFIGAYSPESAGDYASGTNHSLPTYGYAKSFGGVSLESFMKAITYQKLTKAGLRNISKTVINLAETEKLQAHANAVKVRLKK